MQADVAGGIVAAGDFVHGRAVDDDFHRVGFADGLERVPFTGGFFSGWQRHFYSVPAIVDWFRTGRAALHPKITLMIVHSLALDAIGPDLVCRCVRSAVLHENADAGVNGFGHICRETPFNGDFEIGIFFLRAHITCRFAGALDEAIGNAPRFHRVGVAALKKRPAGKIFAIEKLGVAGRGDGVLRGGF